MAFLEYGYEGSLNGTTNVEVVAAPASATRRIVKSVHFCNVDTAAKTIVLIKKKASTEYELAREILQPGEYWTFEKTTIVDATDESLIAKMTAAVTTTNPTFDAAFADAT